MKRNDNPKKTNRVRVLTLVEMYTMIVESVIVVHNLLHRAHDTYSAANLYLCAQHNIRRYPNGCVSTLL